MTVVATDGLTIAADSLMTFGHERSLLPSTKIHARDGYVFGMAGAGGFAPEAIDWYLSENRDPKDCPVPDDDWWTMIVRDPAGTWTMVHSKVRRTVPVTPPFAIGSGAEFALGAMLADASPKEAVEIACKLCTTCGLPVQVINIAEALGLHREAAE